VKNVFCGRKRRNIFANEVLLEATCWRGHVEIWPATFFDTGPAVDAVFDWGNQSQGAALLARALLLQVMRDEAKASMWTTEFLVEVVANLPEQWVLTEGDIQLWFRVLPKASGNGSVDHA
jgi:Family of unknown function (DUF6166)